MEITPASILPIFILGLLNTGVGCYLYFSSIGKLKVQTVAICGYLEPLSAVIFSVVFLKETMLPFQILGAVFIIGGAMFAELSKSIAYHSDSYQSAKSSLNATAREAPKR